MVVTQTSASSSALAWASYFKVLRQSLFVIGKALTGKLSCTRTGLVKVDPLWEGFYHPGKQKLFF